MQGFQDEFSLSSGLKAIDTLVWDSKQKSWGSRTLPQGLVLPLLGITAILSGTGLVLCQAAGGASVYMYALETSTALSLTFINVFFISIVLPLPHFCNHATPAQAEN